MALVKCPDCGKMVSPRVTNCPECGCPAQYFVEDERVSDAVEDKATIQFDLLSYSCKIAEDVSMIASELGKYLADADKAEQEIKKRYYGAGNIATVMENYADWFTEITQPSMNRALAFLHDMNIDMMDYELIGNHSYLSGLNPEIFIEEVLDKYATIVGVKNQLEINRQVKKDSRSQWVGGGFGLKGAIKGAVQAGAMNMASGALHSIGDAFQTYSDNSKVLEASLNLYNDEQTLIKFINAVREYIVCIYIALYDELQNRRIIDDSFKIDKIGATKVIANSMVYDNDNEKKVNSWIKAICMDPTQIEIYDDIYRVMINTDNDFKKWIEFWGLEQFFGTLDKDLLQVQQSLEIESKYNLKEFDFENTSEDNALRLRKILFEEYCNNGFAWDTNSVVGNSIITYSQMLPDSILRNSSLFSKMPQMDVDTFIKLLHFDAMYFHPFIEKLMEDYNTLSGGADAAKLVLQEDAKIILFTNSAFALGTKIFALTDTAFWDIAHKKQVRLENVKSITVESDGYDSSQIVISDGVTEIKWNDDKPEKMGKNPERYAYIANVICAVTNRFTTNIDLQVTNKMTMVVGTEGEETDDVIRAESVMWNMTNGLMQLTNKEIIFTSKKKQDVIRVKLEDIKSVEKDENTFLGQRYPLVRLKYKGKLTAVDINVQDNDAWINDIKNAMNR